MRKVWRLAAVCISVLMLGGCGGQEETVKLTTDTSGVKVEMQLEAKGDTIHTMTQTSTVEVGELTDEQKTLVEDEIKKAEANFADIKGAEYTYEFGDTELKETITIDMTDSDSLDQLSSKNLLPIEGSTSKISLKATKTNLEEQGWTVVE